MAVLSSTTRQTRKPYRRQAMIWLLMTLVLAIVTALLWMFVQTPAMGSKIENAPIAMPNVSTEELKQPLAIEALHELDTDVQPISFEDTIRDLRSYPDEFKDKRYLLANQGKWTVQVMNVAENDVIASYLESRDDRNKFAYFRYRDEDNQLRYMLTYGIMSSPQEAVGAAKLVDFGLPSDVRVLPEEINRYVSIIDNYERPEPLKDLSTKRARSVRLQPTRREVPVNRPAPPPVKEETADTSTNKQTANESSNSSTNASSTTESIRKSEDTSATLSVKEERTVETDADQGSATPKKPSPAQETSKPPVVPAPKPPSNTNNNAGSNNSAVSAPKENKDSIKELIEEKVN